MSKTSDQIKEALSREPKTSKEQTDRFLYVFGMVPKLLAELEALERKVAASKALAKAVEGMSVRYEETALIENERWAGEQVSKRWREQRDAALTQYRGAIKE